MSGILSKIRKAASGDHGELTELSFASKRYWQYPDHYFAAWQSELTISGSYLEQNVVYVAEDKGIIVGYYALVLLEKDLLLPGQTLDRGYWLDHMFILPEYIGKGLGRKLFAHVCSLCIKEGITRFELLADPYAREFYEKMGCVYIKDVSSSIEGRTTPLLRMNLLSPEHSFFDCCPE